MHSYQCQRCSCAEPWQQQRCLTGTNSHEATKVPAAAAGAAADSAGAADVAVLVSGAGDCQSCSWYC